MVQYVTKYWSISHEIGTQQQRDQCQNVSLGHNFCYRTVDCSQMNKKWPLKIINQFSINLECHQE